MDRTSTKVRASMRHALVILSLALPGCTYQAWYAGLQERQRQECYKNSTSQSDTRQCLDRVNNMTYDQYQSQREQLVDRTRP
jgi:hypothetical protein